MQYESVRCNECGAMLQVPSSARYVTCNHCNVSLEVHRTSIATYTEALPQRSESAPPRESDPAWREMADRLEYMERQNELARIDREWDMERERYMQYSRYGRRTIPSTTTSIVVGVIFGTIGLGMLCVGLVLGIFTQSPEGFICCLPGLFFLAIGTIASVVNYNSAQRYQRAYQDYLDRRSMVTDDRPVRRDEDRPVRRDEDY